MPTKICLKCKIEKQLSEFHKWQKGKDGLKPYCKKCRAKDSLIYRASPEIRIKIMEYGKVFRLTNKEFHKLNERERRKKFPEKYREAQKKYKEKQIAEGSTTFKKNKYKYYEKYKEKIKEWKQSKNGKESKKRTYQREKILYPEKIKAQRLLNFKIKSGEIIRKPCLVCGQLAQGHHPSYDKPLDVIWLCPKHHVMIHRKQDIMLFPKQIFREYLTYPGMGNNLI
jgi:hypothetical protein